MQFTARRPFPRAESQLRMRRSFLGVHAETSIPSSALCYTSIGYNMLAGHKFVKTYLEADVEIGAIIRSIRSKINHSLIIILFLEIRLNLF